MPSSDFLKDNLTEKEKRSVDILEILRRRGPISRPDISKDLGINVVTISNYVDEFLKRKLVIERALDVSEGGRRPSLLDLNPSGGYVIGVGLNLSNMVGVLLDLKGRIVTKTQIVKPRPAVREISDCLLEIVREILRRSKEYTSDIKGIGIGIAGLVNRREGTIHWPQKSDHTYTYASIDVPLSGLLEKEFNLPVLLENDATSACFGEYWLNLKGAFKNIVYMFSGVGCGIVVNGEIYTGAQGYAGEVSVNNYKQDELFNCEFGNNCFLKRWEIDIGIIDETKSLLTKDKDKAREFFKLTSSTMANLDLKSVFIANRNGNEVARLALDKAAGRLGIKIASLVNLLNPEVVIIGGGLEEAGEEFLRKVNLTMKEWAFREAMEDLRIIYSQLRENAVAVGAASIVTQRVFAGLL